MRRSLDNSFEWLYGRGYNCESKLSEACGWIDVKLSLLKLVVEVYYSDSEIVYVCDSDGSEFDVCYSDETTFMFIIVIDR